MRDHRNHIVATRFKAVESLLERCSWERATETVPLEDAVGRVLATTLCALHDLPTKPVSNMDAIAVRFDDVAGKELDVAAWERGRDFQFCNTGVAMPDGFDTAIAIENVEFGESDEITALLHIPEMRGEAVSPVGSALEKGCELVSAGTVLGPVHVALLAQGGHTAVEVVRKPRVTFIPTGNELVDPCAEPPAGKNIDCNSANIVAKLAGWGAEVQRHPIVADQWDALKEALDEATEAADIVVINAGSSKGSDDYTCEILEKYGEVLYHETDTAPGKHTSGSILNGTPVVGISGPPVAADLNIEMFAKPLIDDFLLGAPQEPPVIYAHIDEDFPLQPRGANIARRVRLSRDGEGYLWAHVLPMNAPVLKDCAEADGLIITRKESYGYAAGEQVPVQLLWPYTVRF